jgi:hypothetical protein
MQAQVGTNDGDPIQNLLVYGSYLIILKQRSVYVLGGTDATNFELSGYMIYSGVGLTAMEACELVQERPWFLGSGAMYVYSGGDQAISASDKIQDYINPSVMGDGMAIAPSAYAGSHALYHGRRLYLCMPAIAWQYNDMAVDATNAAKVTSAARPFITADIGRILNVRGTNGFTEGEYTIISVLNGAAILSANVGSAGSTPGYASLCDASNTVAYVFDTRVQAWTRFLDMPVASATSLSSEGDSDDMYIGGTDGQVYLLSFEQYGDKLTPSAAPTAIAYNVRSKGMGREGAQEQAGNDEFYWRENKGEYVLARFSTQEQSTVTLTAGAVRSLETSSVTHTASSGQGIYFRDKIDSGVRGDAFYAELAGSSITPTFITAFCVEITKGRIASEN